METAEAYKLSNLRKVLIGTEKEGQESSWQLTHFSSAFYSWEGSVIWSSVCYQANIDDFLIFASFAKFRDAEASINFGIFLLLRTS